MRKQYAGGAPEAHLSGSIAGSPTTFSTTESVAAYPDGSVGPFVVCLGRATPTEEKILVTSRTANTFTIASRGYDGTTQSDHPTGETVDHVMDANSIDEANAHVNATTRDDHTQYIKVDGTRAFSGGVTITTGGLTATAGNIVASAGNLIASAGDVRALGNSGTPRLYLKQNDGGADNKVFTLIPVAGNLLGRFLNDAEDTSAAWLTVNRSGMTIGTIDLGGPLRVVGATQLFGPHALGTGSGVSRARLGFTATDVVIAAEGDGADRNVIVMAKGAGLVKIQSDASADLLSVGATGNLQAIGSSVKLGPGAFGIGNYLEVSNGFLLRAKNTSGDITLSLGGTATVFTTGAGLAWAEVHTSDPGNGNTNWWLSYNNGSVQSDKNVTLGAADSGGAGFKLLRVPN